MREWNKNEIKRRKETFLHNSIIFNALRLLAHQINQPFMIFSRNFNNLFNERKCFASEIKSLVGGEAAKFSLNFSHIRSLFSVFQCRFVIHWRSSSVNLPAMLKIPLYTQNIYIYKKERKSYDKSIIIRMNI